MADFDVWLVHNYFTWYTAFHAENEDEVMKLIPMRLQEEGIPRWFMSDAQQIKIQKAGELT
jgi:hypothetical protein